MKKQGILPETVSSRAVILKTFVTTPLLEYIVRTHGVRCVNTLTGFKWMAEKIADYEDAATAALREKEGISWDYEETDLQTRIEVLLRYSNYSVLAVEESFGYLPLDIVRDKDGNAAVLAFAEMLSHLQSIGSAPLKFLEELYRRHGYFEEKTANLIFEGAAGAEVIRKIIDSYTENPPSSINGVSVRKAKDFGRPGYLDEDEKPLPVENFFTFELENDFNVAVRASGTEPKIKYYFFGRANVADQESLANVKKEVGETLKIFARWAETDANERGGLAKKLDATATDQGVSDLEKESAGN